MDRRIMYGLRLPKVWTAIFSIIVLHSIMPIVGRIISRIATTYFLFLLVLLIWLFFLKYRKGVKIVRILPLITIEGILLLDSISAGNGLLSSAYGMLLEMAVLLIGMLLTNLEGKEQKYFCKLIAVAFIITLLTSTVGLLRDPMAARYLTTVDSSSDSRLISLEWQNVGGYSFVYMLLPVYPVVICYMKRTNKPLYIKIGLFALMLAYLINAQFATALLLFLMLSVLWVLPENFSVQKLVFIVIALGLAFFVLRVPLGNLFARIANGTNSYILHERISYISNTLLGVKDTSDVGRRSEVIQLSLQSITQYPIFGTWYMTGRFVGGHTFTLDFIAKYGIVGLGLLIASYRTIYRIQYSGYQKAGYMGYIACSFGAAIILASVNTGTHWFELMVVNPLLLNMVYLHDQVCDSQIYGEP